MPGTGSDRERGAQRLSRLALRPRLLVGLENAQLKEVLALAENEATGAGEDIKALVGGVRDVGAG